MKVIKTFEKFTESDKKDDKPVKKCKARCHRVVKRDENGNRVLWCDGCDRKLKSL
jgi:hypothetical protein